MSSPSVSHWTCAVPKSGGQEADYEDATAIAATHWPVCAAVADGATESVFAGDWAERLVQGIVDTDATTPEALRDAVPEWQAEWREAVRARAEERPWYVKEKAAEGAFAAALGLSLHPDGRWQAVSMGDCCLFHLRGKKCLQSWPFDTSDAFTNRPALVPSRSDRAVPAPETTTDTWRPSDRFVLVTDAVAAWLMRGDPAAVVGRDRGACREAVEIARADGSLRNDDATILVLEVSSLPEADEEASVCS